MSRLLRLEFWLFAIAGLIVGATLLAGPGRNSFAGHAIPYLALVWMVLAIAWMFKTILRRAREE